MVDGATWKSPSMGRAEHCGGLHVVGVVVKVHQTPLHGAQSAFGGNDLQPFRCLLEQQRLGNRPTVAIGDVVPAPTKPSTYNATIKNAYR